MTNTRSAKIGLIQMSMSDDKNRNLDKAEGMIARAARKGAQIVCLPELFSSLYFPQEEKAKPNAEAVPGPITSMLSRAARENSVVLIGGSIFEKTRNKKFNTSVVFNEEGRMLGKYRKVHLPNDPGFYEKEYFDPGNGYQVFETRFCRIGVLICFDQWYPEPARILRLKGAEIIFYPTAIGRVKGIDQVEGDWHEAWENVQVGHAISNSVAVAAVNRVGRENDTTFWGGSFVCDQFGRILTRAKNEEGISIATVDFSLGTNIEKGWGFILNRKPSTYSRISK